MAKRKIIENPPYLDEEEKRMIESIDYSKANRDKNSELAKQLKQAAKNTANPPKTQISTRLSKYDLSKLKVIAMEKGIPYQTLLGSIVHQYVEGRLKEV